MLKNNRRWLMLMLAFLGIFICYIDRSALSYAITPIQHEFRLNNTQFGYLLSAFAIGYLLMVTISGHLVDKHGARKIWTGAAILWSICTILVGLCDFFFGLIFLRLCVGIFESPALPSLSKVSTMWLPSHERSRSMALGLTAVPLSSVLGAPLITHLIATVGWRYMFIVLGASGGLWALTWAVFFRSSPFQAKFISSKEMNYITTAVAEDQGILNMRDIPKTTLKSILLNKTLMINNFAFFAFGYLLFFSITWLPGYIQQTFHLEIKTLGYVLMLPWLVAALFTFATGYVSDYLWQKTASLRISRALIIGICTILSALCFIAMINSHELLIVMVFMSLALALGMAPNCCYYALNADIARDRVATSLGVMVTFFGAAGIIAPAITGFLSHFFGNFNMAVLVMVVLNFLAGGMVLWFLKPDEVLIPETRVLFSDSII